MRQLGIASSTYSLDNKGLLPDFREWLRAVAGDLTTGKLYPYVKSKAVYLCPTDGAALSINASHSPLVARDYSYAMNCLLCHDTDSAKFRTPTHTLLMGEADMARNDYTGLVGPSLWMGSSAAIATRHNLRGHLMFTDTHVERVKTSMAKQLQKSKTFWLPCPTTDIISLTFVNPLPDP
jgi:hypothetical protein